MRHPHRLEEGAVTAFLAALFVGSVGFVIAASVGIVALLTDSRLQVATDLAALSAADTHRGLVSGTVCENALQILQSVGFDLHQCRIVKHGVEIRGHSMVSFFRLESYAVAGTPGQ